MKTILYKPEDNEAVKVISEILRSGGLAAIPTETVYGLAANALDGNAVKKIFEAKGRPQDNPLIVHISSLEEIDPLVREIDPRVFLLAERFWPGPLTVIMKKSNLIPDEVSAGLDTVAIRMPSHPVARAVIKECGFPIAAPSANASGRPSPTKAEHVIADLDGKIDAVLDGGICSVGVESTVITLVTDPPTLLRPGGVTPEQLSEVLGEIAISHAVYEKLNEGEKVQSPGMKYKHYAPRAEVTIIKGDFKSYEHFLKAQKTEVCAVCFESEGKYFEKAIEYGKAGDSVSQARNIFDALRKVDEIGCKRAFVRCPVTEGVGLAVYNRLLRSAAFRVIDLNINIPVIGLTGQTGSGKTTISNAFKECGCCVVDTDKLARIAVDDREVLSKLCEEFGADIVKDGVLDRRELAMRAFGEKEKTEKLNAVTHPKITELTIEEIHKAEKRGAVAAVVDAPVLFESDLVCICDTTVCVTADKKSRINRIIKRDGISETDAELRISAQENEAEYISKSEYVIVNDNLDKAINKAKCIAEEAISNGKKDRS